jgi:hypothetical protein
MKTCTASLSLLTLCLALEALPAIAGELYNNGPSTLETDAYTVNFGFAVSDSFTVAANSTANGASFIYWLNVGDTNVTVDMSIGTSAFGSQVANFTGLVPTSDTDLGDNAYGFDVREDTYTFEGKSLNADTTYWVTLQNASVPSGNPVYWDESSGTSMALDNNAGTIPSESFTILGNAGGGTTPEPTGLVLFGSGLAGCAGLWRRARKP